MKRILGFIVLLGLALSVQSQHDFNAQKADSLFQLLQENHRWMGAVMLRKNGEIVYQNAIGMAPCWRRFVIGVRTIYF
jgi:hypothetical protein